MKKFCYIVIYLGAIGSLGGGSAEIFTEEEQKALFKDSKPLTLECNDEFGITIESFEEISQHGKPEDLDPCFIRCLLVNRGFMDADGMYDHDSAATLVEKYVKDEGRMKTIIHAMNTCHKVNDADVGADEQGQCQRALLLVKCIKSLDVN